jgi:hypothetical protein
MPWIIGIDEAGYGPNLGPLVMSGVACRVPDSLVAADLWQVLEEAVRRPPAPPDGRLLIEDSKVIYSTARGLHGLETGVLSTVTPWRPKETMRLAECIEHFCPSSHAHLQSELWYTGQSFVPVAAHEDEVTEASNRFARACAARQIEWTPVHSVLVCPAQFNQLLEQWGSKGAVLGEGLKYLLRSFRWLGSDAEPLFFYVDKHGGRNTYAALLFNALAEGFVLAEEESQVCSRYRVLGVEREIRFRFQPRADAEHFCVALASMVSKYLRELLMREFNQFWQDHIPGLKPTAGYPGDAARYFTAIKPALERLGVPESAVWRQK